LKPLRHPQRVHAKPNPPRKRARKATANRSHGTSHKKAQKAQNVFPDCFVLYVPFCG
jgi:hypothetical protein